MHPGSNSRCQKWGAGSPSYVPIPTRQLSVRQIQELSLISIQQEHQVAILRPARSQLLNTGSVLFWRVCPVHPAKASVHQNRLWWAWTRVLWKVLKHFDIAQGLFDIPTVQDLIYTSIHRQKQSAKAESVFDYSFQLFSSAVDFCCSVQWQPFRVHLETGGISLTRTGSRFCFRPDDCHQ